MVNDGNDTSQFIGNGHHKKWPCLIDSWAPARMCPANWDWGRVDQRTTILFGFIYTCTFCIAIGPEWLGPYCHHHQPIASFRIQTFWSKNGALNFYVCDDESSIVAHFLTITLIAMAKNTKYLRCPTGNMI